MGLSLHEKETIIRFDATKDKAILWSADPAWKKRITKLGGKRVGDAYEVRIPKRCIKVSTSS